MAVLGEAPRGPAPFHLIFSKKRNDDEIEASRGSKLKLSPLLSSRSGSATVNVACVAWRFLSNLRAIEKRESRNKERQSGEEPGRERTEKLPAQMAVMFC